MFSQQLEELPFSDKLLNNLWEELRAPSFFVVELHAWRLRHSLSSTEHADYELCSSQPRLSVCSPHGSSNLLGTVSVSNDDCTARVTSSAGATSRRIISSTARRIISASVEQCREITCGCTRCCIECVNGNSVELSCMGVLAELQSDSDL